MRTFLSNIVLILIVGSLLSGCKPPHITEQTAHQYKQPFVSADNDFSFTHQQLYEKIYGTNTLRNGGVLDTALIRPYLDSFLVDTLMGYEAASFKLEDYYDQYRVYKLLYHDQLLKKYIEEMVYKKVSYDSQAVIDFYYSRPDLFSLEEQVQIWHILLSDVYFLDGPDSLRYRKLPAEEIDKLVLDKVHEIYRSLDDFEEFKEAAREHSVDERTGMNGGMIGWINKGFFMPPFDSVAFIMRKGDISRPYRDSSGWHILYCEGYFADGIPPIDMDSMFYRSAEQTYVTEKSNHIGKALTDSLFSTIEITFNEQILDSNLYNVPGSTLVAVVNGMDTIDCNEARSLELVYRRRFNIENTTAKMKREMLEMGAGKYRIIQAARDSKVDTLPDMASLKASLRHKYQRVIIEKRRHDPDWNPSEDSMKAYFDANPEEFTIKKPLVVQHIITEDSVFGEYLRDLAMSGYEFLELAEEHYPGDKSIRRELADLGPIGPGDMPESFYQEALTVGEGNISHPVKTEFGYHIIKMVERKESMKFDKARHIIMRDLKRKHRQDTFNAYRDYLYQKFNLTYHQPLYPIHLKPINLRTNK